MVKQLLEEELERRHEKNAERAVAAEAPLVYIDTSDDQLPHSHAPRAL